MNDCKKIALGYSGENEATTVDFDITKTLEAYGTGGSWVLLNRRPGEFSAYPVPAGQLTNDGTRITWTVSSYDVEKEGQGACQLVYSVGDVVKLSVKYETVVRASLVGDYTAPEPYESWLEQLAEYAGQAASSAQEASDSANGAAYSAKQAGESADLAADSACNAATSASSASDSSNNSAFHADRASDAADRASDAAVRAEDAAAGLLDEMPIVKGTAATNVSAILKDGQNEASNSFALALGYMCTASGHESLAEGHYTEASGDYAHAEGYGNETTLRPTIASGRAAHAEGSQTTASGHKSHTEGEMTIASGERGHAEGYNTTASGNASHAEGSGSVASGAKSHAEGTGTIAANTDQHAQGRNNVSLGATYVDIVGWGASASSRKNIQVLDSSGNLHLRGKVYQQATDDACTGGTEISGGGALYAHLVTAVIDSGDGADYGNVIINLLSSSSSQITTVAALKTALTGRIASARGNITGGYGISDIYIWSAYVDQGYIVFSGLDAAMGSLGTATYYSQDSALSGISDTVTQI